MTIQTFKWNQSLYIVIFNNFNNMSAGKIGKYGTMGFKSVNNR